MKGCLRSTSLFNQDSINHPLLASPPPFCVSRSNHQIPRTDPEPWTTEALFTLGDRPEARWSEASAELKTLGHDSTVSYLAECCDMVLKETGLLPHGNPGVVSREEMLLLRSVSGYRVSGSRVWGLGFQKGGDLSLLRSVSGSNVKD
jgi:hypothetical protein